MSLTVIGNRAIRLRCSPGWREFSLNADGTYEIRGFILGGCLHETASASDVAFWLSKHANQPDAETALTRLGWKDVLQRLKRPTAASEAATLGQEALKLEAEIERLEQLTPSERSRTAEDWARIFHAEEIADPDFDPEDYNPQRTLHRGAAYAANVRSLPELKRKLANLRSGNRP